MNNIEIQLQSGLAAETPLILGEDLTDIRRAYLASSVAQTYGLDDKLVPIITHITSIPKEVYVNEVYEIEFSNGLHIKCAPTTLFYSVTGFEMAKNIKINESFLGCYLNPDSNEIKGKLFDCVTANRKILAIQQPLYYFISESTNILIPHFDQNKNLMTFIGIHQ